MNLRPDGRARADQMRPVRLELGVNRHAEGSCLAEFGRTRVWVTASVEDRVPPHRRGTGHGWITAEYSMLPRSTHDRGQRESTSGRLGGRTQEIQRLIGRSLRTAFDLGALGERTVAVDCDVLQADGGTRTAAVTGAFCAVHQALSRLQQARLIPTLPVRHFVSAVSVGIVEGLPRLDLDYAEDSLADTDMNCVLTESGAVIEVQATAEREPLTRSDLDLLLELARLGTGQLARLQHRLLEAGA